MAQPQTLVDALRASVQAEPGRPLLTFYDTSSGERIELSATTLDNWVNKIANLLSDDLGLDAEASIRIDLPAHWLSVVTALAAWTAGLRLAAPVTSHPVDAWVVGPEAVSQAAHADGPTGVVLACSLRPLAGPFTDPLPAGWLDFAREVPGQPDVLLQPAHRAGSDVALEGTDGSITHAQLIEQGTAAAEQLGLGSGGRLVTDLDPVEPTLGIAACLSAPLVTRSSLVLVVGADVEIRKRITTEERGTCVHWTAR